MCATSLAGDGVYRKVVKFQSWHCRGMPSTVATSVLSALNMLLKMCLSWQLKVLFESLVITSSSGRRAFRMRVGSIRIRGGGASSNWDDDASF